MRRSSPSLSSAGAAALDGVGTIARSTGRAERTRGSSISTTTTGTRWRSRPGPEAPWAARCACRIRRWRAPRRSRQAIARRRRASPRPTGTRSRGSSRPAVRRRRKRSSGSCSASRPGSPTIRTGCAGRTRARFSPPGRAYCVGFAELAVDLLGRIGISARTVQGVLATEPGADGYEAKLGGAFHRWIEVYYPDRGYVFSDPLASVNGVDARYVRILAARLDPSAKPRPDVAAPEPGDLSYATLRAGDKTLRVRATSPDSAAPVIPSVPDLRPSTLDSLAIFAGSMSEKYPHAEIDAKWQRRWEENARGLRRHGVAGRQVLHAQHVPVSLGEPAPCRARAQLHPGRRALPPRADGRAQGLEPDGMGRVRTARRERRHRRAASIPREYTLGNIARDEGAALEPRAPLRLVQGARLLRSARTTAGTSGSSCACGSGASRTARRLPSTGARAAGPCSPTSRSSTGAASGPTTWSRSGT